MLHSKAQDLMEPMELIAGGLAKANQRIDAMDTSYSGSISFNNEDGSMTVIGPMAGDFSFATHVGDTTPPPMPAGIECSSVDGTVLVTWDGTLIDEMPPDFYCINIAVNDIVFARLTEAGSANSPKLGSGSVATISVTSEDDACLWDGTPAHNISEPITVEVEVTDVIGEAKAEAKEAIDAAKESAEKVIELEQTAEALAASVSIAQETADNAVTAASTAQQDINGFKTTVEENYLSKDEAETTYTAKSEFEQTTQGLTATVIEAATRADTALTKAAQAEITASGFSVAITEAQQTADDAKKVATNYLSYTAAGGLVVADQVEDELGDNVQIKPGSVNIRSGETTNASFTSNKISLGLNGADSVIDFCNGLGEVNYHLNGDIENGVGTGIQLSSPFGASVSSKGVPNGQNAVVQARAGTASIYGTSSVTIGSNAIYINPSKVGALTAQPSLNIGSNGNPSDTNVMIGDGEFVGTAWKDLDNQWTGTLTSLINILNSWEKAHWAPSDNLNNIKRSGIFLWQPATTGIPQASTWGVGLSLSNTLTASSGTWCMQLGMCTNNDGKLWVRQSINNGAWTAWKQVGDNVAYTSHANSQKALGIYTGGVTLGAGSAAGWHQVWTKAQFNSKFAGYNPTNTSIYFMDHVGGNSSIVYDCMVDGNQTVWLRSRTDGGAYTGSVSARYQVIAGSNT